eukprot:Skav214769  [mRNA]  locus=scaffold3923:1650:2624:- [translate_table: standard]
MAKGLMNQFEQFSSSASTTQSSSHGGDDLPAGDDFAGSGDENPNDNENSSDDPDDGDDDDGNFFDQSEEFTVFLSLNAIGIRVTKSITVKPSWQLKILKRILFSSYKVKVSWVRFCSSAGNTLYDHLTFTANNVKHRDTITVQIRARGGGKRGQSGAVKKSKENELKEMKEKIASMLMRLSGTQCLSPSIDCAKNEVLTVAKMLEDDPKKIVSKILEQLDAGKVKQLSKEVMSCSTRPVERTKKASSILFKSHLDALEELDRQRTTAIALFSEMTHYCFMVQFGDSASNISWEDWSELVTNFLTEGEEIADDVDLSFGGLNLTS